MCGVIFVVFVHVVNIEKFQYLNVIVKGLMCQTGFYLIETHGGYVGINLSGFAALVHKQVTSQRSPGRQKSIPINRDKLCLAALATRVWFLQRPGRQMLVFSSR